MKLINMKITEQNKLPESIVLSENKYPWGLEINLEEESIKKLSMKNMPNAGDIVNLTALCKVTNVGEKDSTESGKKRNLSLQITDMILQNENKKEDGIKKLYGE